MQCFQVSFYAACVNVQNFETGTSRINGSHVIALTAWCHLCICTLRTINLLSTFLQNLLKSVSPTGAPVKYN